MSTSWWCVDEDSDGRHDNLDAVRLFIDADVGLVGDLYRISGIPMTYITDRNGIITARGLRDENLIAEIRELIGTEN